MRRTVGWFTGCGVGRTVGCCIGCVVVRKLGLAVVGATGGRGGARCPKITNN